MKQLVFSLILLALLTTCTFGQQLTADLILFNGRVFTANPANPNSQAIAISGDRILAVGTTGEISALAGPKTRRIDLQGRLVIPGINDAHYHHTPEATGHYLPFKDMEPNWQEVLNAVDRAVKQVQKGTWIFGTVGLAVVAEPEATRFGLDRIAPDHPVMLRAYFGHGNIINSKAMSSLGLREEEPDPVAGYFERVSGSRRINGRAFEYADWRLSRQLAEKVSDEEAIKSIRAFADQAIRYGITSVQNMPMLSADRYVALLEKAAVPIRMRVVRFPMTDAKGRDLKEGKNLRPSASPLVTVSGTKWILDGTPLERGAALRQSYHDRKEWSGRLNFSAKEIASIVRESLTNKEQLLVHCSGDRPVQLLFGAMESMGPKIDWKKLRVRVEHGDGVTGDLLTRAQRLGVIVVQNPSHFTLTEIIPARYGPNHRFFPLRTLLEENIPVAFGSDGLLNPYFNLMFAITHPVSRGEAITLEQAVTAYTRGSAFAEFAEHEKGSIEKGKLADLAVLSQDIFTVPLGELPKTRSVLTIVGGKIVYDVASLSLRTSKR